MAVVFLKMYFSMMSFYMLHSKANVKLRAAFFTNFKFPFQSFCLFYLCYLVYIWYLRFMPILFLNNSGDCFCMTLTRWDSVSMKHVGRTTYDFHVNWRRWGWKVSRLRYTEYNQVSLYSLEFGFSFLYENNLNFENAFETKTIVRRKKLQPKLIASNVPG